MPDSNRATLACRTETSGLFGYLSPMGEIVQHRTDVAHAKLEFDKLHILAAPIHSMYALLKVTAAAG